MNTDGWMHPEVPAAQARLADRELVEWRAGGQHGPFDAARALLRAMQPAPASLLEVGCGAGYYAEIIAGEHPHATYYGCDYAPGMVAQARARYPHRPFTACDQRDLAFYADGSVDCAWSGGALLHLMSADEWAQAIAELRRVTRRWVVLHRVPVRLTGLPALVIENDFYDSAAPTKIPERFAARDEWHALLATMRVVGMECWSPPDADPQWESVLAEVKKNPC